MPQCEEILYVTGNYTSTPNRESSEQQTEHPMAHFMKYSFEQENPDNLIDSPVNELEEGRVPLPTNAQESTDNDPNKRLTRLIEWPKYSSSTTESGYFSEITGPHGFGRIPDTTQPIGNAEIVKPKYSGWYDLMKKVQEKGTIDTNKGNNPNLPIPGTSSTTNTSLFKSNPYDYDHHYHSIASLDPVVCKRNLMAVIDDHKYATGVEEDSNEAVENRDTFYSTTNNDVTESMHRDEQNCQAERYSLHIPDAQDPSTENALDPVNTAEIHSINDNINALVTGQLEFGPETFAMENGCFYSNNVVIEEIVDNDCHTTKILQNHSDIEKEFTEGEIAKEYNQSCPDSHELNEKNEDFIDLSPSFQADPKHDSLDKLMERLVNI